MQPFLGLLPQRSRISGQSLGFLALRPVSSTPAKPHFRPLAGVPRSTAGLPNPSEAAFRVTRWGSSLHGRSPQPQRSRISGYSLGFLAHRPVSSTPAKPHFRPLAGVPRSTAGLLNPSEAAFPATRWGSPLHCRSPRPQRRRISSYSLGFLAPRPVSSTPAKPHFWLLAGVPRSPAGLLDPSEASFRATRWGSSLHGRSSQPQRSRISGHSLGFLALRPVSSTPAKPHFWPLAGVPRSTAGLLDPSEAAFLATRWGSPLPCRSPQPQRSRISGHSLGFLVLRPVSSTPAKPHFGSLAGVPRSPAGLLDPSEAAFLATRWGSPLPCRSPRPQRRRISGHSLGFLAPRPVSSTPAKPHSTKRAPAHHKECSCTPQKVPLPENRIDRTAAVCIRTNYVIVKDQSILRMIWRTGRMEDGLMDSSSIPHLTNCSVSSGSAPSSPQMPTQVLWR